MVPGKGGMKQNYTYSAIALRKELIETLEKNRVLRTLYKHMATIHNKHKNFSNFKNKYTHTAMKIQILQKTRQSKNRDNTKCYIHQRLNSFILIDVLIFY